MGYNRVQDSRYNLLSLEELERLRYEKLEELRMLSGELELEINAITKQIYRRRMDSCPACILKNEATSKRIINRLSSSIRMSSNRINVQHTCGM